MVSRDTKVTAVFALLGTILWLVTTQVTDVLWVQWAVLVGVGIGVPTALNERRRAEDG